MNNRTQNVNSILDELHVNEGIISKAKELAGKEKNSYEVIYHFKNNSTCTNTRKAKTIEAYSVEDARAIAEKNIGGQGGVIDSVRLNKSNTPKGNLEKAEKDEKDYNEKMRKREEKEDAKAAVRRDKEKARNDKYRDKMNKKLYGNK